MSQQSIIFNSLFNSYVIYDYDGNGYSSVIIGDQEWIGQNYRSTHYANGNTIPYISSSTNWLNDVSGAYCEYNNALNTYKNPYGYLYNWYAMNNSNGFVYLKRNGVRETDWRVPTQTDIEQLDSYIGSDAQKIKKAGTSYWISPNYGTDDYGFGLVGAGLRVDTDASFYNIKIVSLLATITELGPENFYLCYDTAYNNGLLFPGYQEKNVGASVRCLRDLNLGLILSFITNSSTTAFTPQVTTTAGIVKWNLGDSSYNENSNSIAHQYSTDGNKTVKLYKGTTDGSSAIYGFQFAANNIVGTLDISCLTDVSTTMYMHNNTELTTIKNPVTKYPLSTGYSAYNCNLTGTLDVSGIKGFAGFNVSLNPSLNYILHPPNSSTIMSSYYAYNCGLKGTLDVSGLSGLGGIFSIQNNPNLNYILNPSSNQVISSYEVAACGLMGTLDLRPLKKLGGGIYLPNNPSLNTILNPDSSQNFSYYQAYDCGLTGTFDISSLTNFGGMLVVNSNTRLNYILNPSSNQSITTYYAYGCGLMGTLDLRPLKKLGGAFSVASNPSLNYILNPSNNEIFSAYVANACGLIGSLDVSALRGLGGTFHVSNNSKLNYILNPNSSTAFSYYWVDTCGLMGTLDLRGLTRLGGDLRFNDNPSLNYILHPSSSEYVYSYWASNCSLAGTLDVSGFSRIGTYIMVDSNKNLKRILLPPFDVSCVRFFAYDCSLDLFTVNDVLAKFYSYYNTHSHNASVYIDLSGGRNMSPTGGWSNTNITNLYSIFDPPYDISIKINA